MNECEYCEDPVKHGVGPRLPDMELKKGQNPKRIWVHIPVTGHTTTAQPKYRIPCRLQD